MRPPICDICKKRFSPSSKKSGLIQFLLTDEEKEKMQQRKAKRIIGHPIGRKWFCEIHYPVAVNFKHLHWSEARHQIKAQPVVEEEVSLKKDWEALCRKYTDDDALILNYWTELKTKYSKSNRYYHNLDHIKSMLSLSARHQSRLSDPDVVQFAIWYHDIVYNYMRKDNEEKSAIIAGQRLKVLGLNFEQINDCMEMIRCTQNHKPNREDIDDVHYLLDFDLKVLSWERADYKQYTQNIRKEYVLVPGMIYRKGRKKAMQQFLEREQIYYAPEFEQYESTARENIEWELKSMM